MSANGDNSLDEFIDHFTHSYGLKFSDPKQEALFLKSYAEVFHYHVRIAIYVGIGFFVLAGTLDLILLSDRIGEIWSIRYPFYLPALAALGLLTFTRLFDRVQQWMIGAMVILMGTAMIRIVFATEGAISQIYFNGLMLTEMAGLTGTRLLFRNGVICSVLLFSLLSVGFYFYSEESAKIIIGDLYLFVGMTFVSLMSSYFLERASRITFLKRQNIRQKQDELSAANIKLRQLAASDGLTGVANRRSFDTVINEEWARAQRDGYPLALLMIDIDYFKRYNDSYGHQAGDECLVQVAKVLESFTNRAGDSVARYGGEEFALILPRSSLNDAIVIGKTIVKAIQDRNILHNDSAVATVVTVCVGVSSMVPQSDITSNKLIKEADQRLYYAKRNGRNQCYPDSVEEAESDENGSNGNSF